MLATRLIRFAVALLTLSMIAPALAEDVTFTGLVTYRERMALPPDSTLIVNLVALPGQQRIAGASADLAGKVGSPIGFTLDVRSDVLAAGGSFGLVAEVWNRGRLIFANRQPVAVDTRMPSGILIPVQSDPAPPPYTEVTPPPPLDPPEAAPPLPQPPSGLLDIIWSVTSIGGDPVLPGSKLTLSIAADHRAGGQGGCNNYFTEASFEDSAVAFGPVAGTRMACNPAIMAQEARFFATLGATAGYELEGSALKLVDAAGVPLAGLVRAP